MNGSKGFVDGAFALGTDGLRLLANDSLKKMNSLVLRFLKYRKSPVFFMAQNGYGENLFFHPKTSSSYF